MFMFINTPGTHVMMDNELITEHCINSTSKTFYGDEWVNLEVLVIKDSIISHSINDDLYIEYQDETIESYKCVFKAIFEKSKK